MSGSALMPVGDMTQLAKAVASSKLFGMQTPEQALVLMALCQSEGKNPIQAVRQYHIINGRPSMRADAMLAEFQAQGGTVEWGERTNSAVTGTFSHPKGGNLTVTWTMEDAVAAQLTGNPTWKKFPRQMLTARVISEAIRTVLPGVVAGIYTPEEVADMPVIEGQVVSPAPRPREIAPKELAPAPPAPDEAKAAAIARFVDTAGKHGVDAGKPENRRNLLVAVLWPDGNAPQRVATAEEWDAAATLIEDNGIPARYTDELTAVRRSSPAQAPRPAPKPEPAPAPPVTEIDTTDLDDPFAD